MHDPIAASMLVFCFLVSDPAAAEPVRQKAVNYVGEIIITGNTVTQEHVIRKALVGIYPGQILRRRQLRKAERKLAALGLFVVDRSQNIRPRVLALKSPGPFKDILVRVQEKFTRNWELDAGLNSVGQPIIRLIMNDRNFDPFRFPYFLNELTQGVAFRGGGQRARIEVLRLNLFQARLEFFADGSLLPAVMRAWTDGIL